MKRLVVIFLLLIVIISVKFISCSEEEGLQYCDFPPNVRVVSCSNNMAFNDVASDCIHHWCISYLGSRGFCSKTCIDNSDCPSGFKCLKDFASLDPELKHTAFCVPKQNLECIAGMSDGGVNISDSGTSDDASK